MQSMASIFKFIGIKSPGTSQIESIADSLKKSINYSLNITKSWRTGLELQELLKIDQACKLFYETGYYSSVTTGVAKKGEDYEGGGGNNEDVYN